MIEKFLAYSLLLKSNLLTFNKFGEFLDQEFLNNPDNDLLLELQCRYKDVQKTTDIIDYAANITDINYNSFGKYLMKGLKSFYIEYGFDIHSFASKVLSLWHLLPSEISQMQPYHTMTYADDPLTWNDEAHSRRLYEEMFEFFEE